MKLRILLILGVLLMLFGSKSAKAQQDTLTISHQLLLAAYQNSTDSVLYYLKQGAKLNYYDDNGMTALMYAVQNNNIDLVKLLVFNGSSIDQLNSQSNSALLIAARLGFFDVAEYLCFAGANVNHKNYDGLTALHFAATYADFFMADMLLFYHANIDVLCAEKNTPLHYAVYSGDTAIINLLISKNANLYLLNDDDISPIEIAVQYHLHPAFNCLLDVDTSLINNQVAINNLLVKAVFFKNDSAFFRLSNRIINPKSSPSSLENPIYIARQFQHKQYLKVLKSVGYTDSKNLHIAQHFFNFGFRFSSNDHFFNFNYGLRDNRYNLDFYLGYSTRFKRMPIIIPTNDSVSYLYRERRNSMNFGLTYRIYPFNQIPNFNIYIGPELQIHFGSYAGSNKRLNQNFYFAAISGLQYQFKWISLNIAYKYADYEIFNHNPHWIDLGLGVFVDVISKPEYFKIQWL